MADLIMLGLLVATAVLFIALTLDEVTHRIELRYSNRTLLGSSNEVARQPTLELVKGDQDREAA